MQASRVALLLMLVMFFAVACGPIVMIPGGALSGTPRSVPANWDFTDDVETFVLETRPPNPYSVNVWAVAAGGNLYVAAGKPGNAWAGYIAADRRVRLKVNDDIFELAATATRDPADRALFLAAVKKKYDYEPEGDDPNEAVLFRLQPR